MAENHRRQKLIPVSLIAIGLIFLAYAYVMDNTVDVLLGIATIILGVVSLWVESTSGDQ